jgi:hypothetical protein
MLDIKEIQKYALTEKRLECSNGHKPQKIFLLVHFSKWGIIIFSLQENKYNFKDYAHIKLKPFNSYTQ